MENHNFLFGRTIIKEFNFYVIFSKLKLITKFTKIDGHE